MLVALFSCSGLYKYMGCYAPLAGIKKVFIATVTGDSINYFITTGETIVLVDPIVFKEYEFADGTFKESWESTQQGVVYTKQFDFEFSDFTDESIFDLENKNLVIVFQDLACRTFIVGHDRTFSVNKSEASDNSSDNRIDFSIKQTGYSRKQLLDENFNIEFDGDWFDSSDSLFNIYNPTGQTNFSIAFWYTFQPSGDADQIILKRDTQFIIGKNTDGIYFKTSSDGLTYDTGTTTTIQLSANTQYFIACYKNTNQGSIFIYNWTDGLGQTVSSYQFDITSVTGSTFELSTQQEVKGLGIWNKVDLLELEALKNNLVPPLYSGLTALNSGLTENLLAYYEIPTFNTNQLKDSHTNNLDLNVHQGSDDGGITFESNCDLGCNCNSSGGGSTTGGTTYSPGEGIDITSNVISVDLAASSGLEFTGGDLRIIPNQFVAIGTFSTYTGVTASLINSKLNTSVFNSYTGATRLVAGDQISLSSSSTGITITSTAEDNFKIDNEFYNPPTVINNYKLDTDIKGSGQIILTNGSTNVSGISTTFTTDTAYVGFGVYVKDSNGDWYVIRLNTPASQTSATIQFSYDWNGILRGFYPSLGTTWPGQSGTYEYFYSKNFAFGSNALAFGFNSNAGSYGVAFGDRNTANSVRAFTAGGANSVSGDSACAFGWSNISAGIASSALGYSTTASGNYSASRNLFTLASGLHSFSGGKGFYSSYSINTNRYDYSKFIRAAGQTAFNFSENTTSQTTGHGVLGANTAILGGLNHNIPSNSSRSVIIGGNTIKASSAVTDTVYLPKLRIGQGTNSTIPTGSTSNNILVRNSSTGEVEIRDASTLGSSGSTSTLDAANGIRKVGEGYFKLGGDLTGSTVFTDNRVTKRGLQYAADYTTGYTTLSIPHYGFVTGQTATKLPTTTFATFTANTYQYYYDNIDTFYLEQDDFIFGPAGNLGTSSAWQASNSGTATAISQSNFGVDSTDCGFGVISINSGSQSSSRSSLTKSSLSHLFGRDTEISLKWRVAIEALGNVTNSYGIVIGHQDNFGSNLPVDGVFFLYNSALSPNWLAYTSSNSVVSTGNTGYVAVASTFNTFEIIVNAAATSATFKINGVVTNTLTSQIPTGSGRQTGIGIKVERTASDGSTTRSAYVDYYALLCKRSTPR